MNSESVAIFDFAFKCLLLIDFLHMGLANSITPKIYNIWKSNNDQSSSIQENYYHNTFSVINLMIIPALVLVMPIIIPLFIRNINFYTAFQYLNIISIGFVFKVLFNMFYFQFIFFKKTYKLLIINIIVAILQIVFDFILIKLYGIWGAIAVFVVIKPIQIWLMYRESKKFFKIKFNFFKILFLPLIYTILIITIQLLFPNKNLFLRNSIICFFTYLLIFWVFRNEIKLTFEKYVKKRFF